MRVVYVSDLVCDKSKVPGELFNIAYIAAKFNRSHGIGGFFSADKEKLICVQMFEGSYEVTAKLWTRIQKDRRHKIRGGSMVSYPETVLAKWGMPLQEPAVLLKNLQSLNIDTSGLIESVLNKKKAPAVADPALERLSEKIAAYAAASETEKPLIQSQLQSALTAELLAWEAAQKRSVEAQLQELEGQLNLVRSRMRAVEALEDKDEDVPEEQMDDLNKAYAILRRMAVGSC